jgi:hypothetical protein
MDRFWFEPGEIDLIDFDEDGFFGYLIYDRTHGNTHGKHIAFCTNIDVVERIVNALNDTSYATARYKRCP